MAMESIRASELYTTIAPQVHDLRESTHLDIR